MTVPARVDVHYQHTLDLYHAIDMDALTFGHSAILDIKKGVTIRQMSIDLCGNEGLENKISRYIEAAKWDSLVKHDNGQLYEDARCWLSVSHFYILYRYMARLDDYDAARDVMEQCLIRDAVRNVTETRSVEWLRAKVKDPALPSVDVLKQRVWKSSSKLLADMQSALASKGLEATKADRRRVRLLKAVVCEFAEIENNG